MAKFDVSPNMDKYSKQLQELYQTAPEMIAEAVREGANPVADEIRARLDALPTDDRFVYVHLGERLKGPRTKQKQGLQHTLGISPIRDDNGYINLKIGFSGYNLLKTYSYPKGQPNPMIAASIENGTSYMQANPFILRSVRKKKKKSVDIMNNSINSWVTRLMSQQAK